MGHNLLAQLPKGQNASRVSGYRQISHSKGANAHVYFKAVQCAQQCHAFNMLHFTCLCDLIFRNIAFLASYAIQCNKHATQSHACGSPSGVLFHRSLKVLEKKMMPAKALKKTCASPCSPQVWPMLQCSTQHRVRVAGGLHIYSSWHTARKVYYHLGS